MRVVRHLVAIALLPGVVAVLIPAALLDGTELGPLAPLGAPLLALGLGMWAWTVGLFATVGQGTLAPWDPPQRFVARGPYRRVRNPMISGVVAILLGEAALFGSWPVFWWAVTVFAINHVYFLAVEEPDLRHRFGGDYEAYMARTPRWLPRVRA